MVLPQASPSIYQSSKCFVTYGTMGHVDPHQVPRKGKPWAAISELDFIHKVDLIVPQNRYLIIRQKLNEREPPCYYRVSMTLGQILETEFLTEYIKKGNILMLSEGKTTVDNMFTLQQGTLDMYLDKETYERAGLLGKPYGVKGNRGSKPRWKASYDLRSPTMLHGKKGFDRLIYACKNVLNQPLTWLFCNAAKSTPIPDPLEKHAATRLTSPPKMAQDTGIFQIPLQIPSSVLANGDRPGLEEAATEMYEWLSLVRLESPRVAAKDDIDPYLSRYSLPEAETPDADTQMQQICKVSWQGFLPSSWLRDLLVDVLATGPPRSWFALSATAFSQSVPGNSAELTFLQPPEKVGEYLMWETKSSD